jgi:hypothetical protein
MTASFERRAASSSIALAGALLGSWIDDNAIDAMIERRDRMVRDVKKLVAKRGRSAVIIP